MDEKTAGILGIDIGGSGIKGALVDIATGALLTERQRIDTPLPATPKAVAETVREVVKALDWQGVIGCGFPAPLHQGIALTAANIDDAWIGTAVDQTLAEATSCSCHVLNDADAAGLAEMRFGAGRGHNGVVLLITVGTGLGSALFCDGVLVPNTEFGHVRLKGDSAERYASDATRKKDDLSWEKWGKRFNRYLRLMESLVWPDLIIIGGGASKKFERFADQLKVKAEVVPATLQNEAGIIGAAVFAAENLSQA